METTTRTTIKIETSINASIEKVWEYWTNPIHILHWNNASADWYTPYAESDLREGGNFLSRMEARDGSFGFDFGGTFNIVEPLKKIVYSIGDGRQVEVLFSSENDKTRIIESFEAEGTHSEEMQREGWNAILTNFKNYVENTSRELVHFQIEINAPVEKVYNSMIHKYTEWTSAFNPDSSYEGSWERGSVIKFMGTDENGEMGGMSSRIRENIPNKFISIEHERMFKGDEFFENETWKGFLENYTFKNVNGKTLLLIDTDTTPEYVGYFNETWPKALQLLKEICER